MSTTSLDPQQSATQASLRARDAVEPPRDALGILKRLGPGLIIAASIVGSGELIATTKTGAQAGIALLWLIIIGCVIKVFAQVEFGRYAISEGETTLAALDRVPGPRYRAGWLVWCWLAMAFCTIGQLGGIVGGVGQSLAITFPLSGDYLAAISLPAGSAEPHTLDDKYWAAAIAFPTAALLFFGRYGLIQSVSTVLVVAFTFITIGNVISLQMTDQWHIPLADFVRGLSFKLPETESGMSTALKAFGIIGVGATELVAYPYWCLEKGYARFTGPRTADAGWADRARGWIRVMKFDAFLSMFIYTIATLAFFLMGVAVLHSSGLDPAGMRMVSTLAEAYVPVFGEHAKWLFLLGAFAVLFSTYLVANAANARMFSDGVRIIGVIGRNDQRTYDRAVRIMSVILPLLCLAIYVLVPKPVMLVLIAGFAQATMLPLLGFAAVYLRFTRTDRRLHPGRLWDALLILSFLGLIVTGAWGIYEAGIDVTAMFAPETAPDAK